MHPDYFQYPDNQTFFRADGTYKLLWNDFPEAVVGTWDKSRTLHPYGIGVTNGETVDDFKEIFKILQQGCSIYLEFYPKVLVADCAPSITNAFTEVFGEVYTRGHCNFYVMKNVKDKVKCIKNQELKDELRSDL